MQKTKKMNRLTHLKNMWEDCIYYKWKRPSKVTVIISTLMVCSMAALIFLFVDMRRIKIEHAKEVWKINQYYRQKEKELNFDRRIWDEEFDINNNELDFYYNRGIGIR